MSSPQQPQHAAAHSGAHPEHEASHEGPIRTTKQLIWAVVASFVVPIVGIILLVNYVNFADKPGAGSDAQTAEAVAKRLARVGTVEVRDANAPVVLRSGAQVTEAACAACHAAGLAGAPKVGDTGAWAPRLKQGYELLLTSALKGKGAMSAQGGGDYSDLEVGRAVVHMANLSGGKLEEPKVAALAAAASGAAAGASAPK